MVGRSREQGIPEGGRKRGWGVPALDAAGGGGQSGGGIKEKKHPKERKQDGSSLRVKISHGRTKTRREKQHGQDLNSYPE